MEIGAGLPTTVPDVTGADLVEWARRADRLGFSTLGVLDRLVYDNHEPLVTLAAAAAVTERIRLATTILIAPYRGATAVLAKQLATIQTLSQGRLVAGLAAGDREDDFLAAGQPFAGRGPRLVETLGELRAIWAGAGIGPRVGPMPVLLGGHSPAAIRRAARMADGWIGGGAPVGRYAEMAALLREEWRLAGRPGRPRLVSLAYTSLGGRSEARRYLSRYYAFLGGKAARMAESVPTEPEQVSDLVAAYRDIGCDELILLPCGRDPDQADLLAKAVHDHL